MDLQHGHFLPKLYAKMKELVAIGGGMCWACPPRSANALSPIAGQDNKAKARIENKGPIQDSPDMINMKLLVPATTKTKVTVQIGSSVDKTLHKSF